VHNQSRVIILITLYWGMIEVGTG